MCSAGTFYNNLINFIQYNKQAVHVKYIVIFVMIRILLLTYIYVETSRTIYLDNFFMPKLTILLFLWSKKLTNIIKHYYEQTLPLVLSGRSILY